MKAIFNQNQLWYCDICDRTFNERSKSKHINSKSHKHKQRYGAFAKKHEIEKPDKNELNYIFNDTIKDCRKKYFQSFEYRCVYDIKFTNL